MGNSADCVRADQPSQAPQRPQVAPVMAEVSTSETTLAAAQPSSTPGKPRVTIQFC